MKNVIQICVALYRIKKYGFKHAWMKEPLKKTHLTWGSDHPPHTRVPAEPAASLQTVSGGHVPRLPIIQGQDDGQMGQDSSAVTPRTRLDPAKTKNLKYSVATIITLRYWGGQRVSCFFHFVLHNMLGNIELNVDTTDNHMALASYFANLSFKKTVLLEIPDFLVPLTMFPW